jgi:hypothetical protein
LISPEFHYDVKTVLGKMESLSGFRLSVGILKALSRVRIQKKLISDLMRKNEEIRGKRLGKL